jgi:hypothetical protein
VAFLPTFFAKEKSWSLYGCSTKKNKKITSLLTNQGFGRYYKMFCRFILTGAGLNKIPMPTSFRPP